MSRNTYSTLEVMTGKKIIVTSMTCSYIRTLWVALSFAFRIREIFEVERTSRDLQSSHLLKAGSILNSDQVALGHLPSGPENIRW